MTCASALLLPSPLPREEWRGPVEWWRWSVPKAGCGIIALAVAEGRKRPVLLCCGYRNELPQTGRQTEVCCHPVPEARGPDGGIGRAGVS